MRFLQTNLSILSGAILMMGAPCIALAQTSTSLSGLYACEALSDANAQLSCFRTETAKLRAADPSAVSGAVSLAPNSSSPDSSIIQKQSLIAGESGSAPDSPALEVKQAEDDSFGFTKPKKPKSRTLAIQSSEPWGNNRYIRFTLENGEVWQQIESGRVRLGKAEPDLLTIKKASFGSFLGRVNDKRPSFRVRRIK